MPSSEEGEMGNKREDDGRSSAESGSGADSTMEHLDVPPLPAMAAPLFVGQVLPEEEQRANDGIIALAHADGGKWSLHEPIGKWKTVFSATGDRMHFEESVVDRLPFLAVQAAPILITGGAGMGKQELARIIATHPQNARRDEQVDILDCASMRADEIAGVLFGNDDREGMLVSSNGGTVIVLQIELMPPECRRRLAAFIKHREVRRLDSDRVAKEVDVRLLATARLDGNGRVPALEEVEYAFPDVVSLSSLRVTPNAILRLLAEFFHPYDGIGEAQVSWLMALLCHAWPDNIRELRRYCEVVRTGCGILNGKDWPLPKAAAGPTTIAPWQSARAILSLFERKLRATGVFPGGMEIPDDLANALRLLVHLGDRWTYVSGPQCEAARNSLCDAYYFHPETVPLALFQGGLRVPICYYDVTSEHPGMLTASTLEGVLLDVAGFAIAPRVLADDGHFRAALETDAVATLRPSQSFVNWVGCLKASLPKYEELAITVSRSLMMPKDGFTPPQRPWLDPANLRSASETDVAAGLLWMRDPNPKNDARLLITHDVNQRLEESAASDGHVLITGETGTGKEGLAWHLMVHGKRQNGPKIPAEFSATEAKDLRSAIFGYWRGAFTGANRDTEGLVHRANGGSLFLDELGNLDLESQGVLLRFMERGEFRRLGGGRPETSDVRIIAATNASPTDEKRIKHDLFPRFRGGHISLPALRELGGKAVCLVLYEHLRGQSVLSGVAVSWLARLVHYRWPANMREVRNYCEDCAKHKTPSGNGCTGHRQKAEDSPVPSGERPSSPGCSHVLDEATDRFIRYPDIMRECTKQVGDAASALLSRYLREHGSTAICGEGEDTDMVLNSLRLLAQVCKRLTRLPPTGCEFHPEGLPLSLLSQPDNLPEAYARSVLRPGQAGTAGPCNLVDALVELSREATRSLPLSGPDVERFLSWVADTEATVPAYAPVDAPAVHRLRLLLDKMRADGRKERDFVVARGIAAGKKVVRIAEEIGVSKEAVSKRAIALRDAYQPFRDVLGDTRFMPRRRRRALCEERSTPY